LIIPRLTKTFPNCQFIVTTHSPQVLSHVDPECIHSLDYEGDNVIVKRPENSFGLDSNRILEDILGVPKRPQEIQDEMLELFKTINNNDDVDRLNQVEILQTYERGWRHLGVLAQPSDECVDRYQKIAMILSSNRQMDSNFLDQLPRLWKDFKLVVIGDIDVISLWQLIDQT
jgi:hypothetical protein